ncbi:hypothetical protein M422DRAFT_54955 [Sphaerobolus stellatus SS14]|uniref:Uncharacterized protein n=1 Tax=Sphaerobolus stellatus (strain SS14) TaxID=990650 RepID=A0A0C9UQP0_SPHS4|nr:hypothetical protein M422DRAFT_54955 [Sphaerobolus stellatus SS14]
MSKFGEKSITSGLSEEFKAAQREYFIFRLENKKVLIYPVSEAQIGEWAGEMRKQQLKISPSTKQDAQRPSMVASKSREDKLRKGRSLVDLNPVFATALYSARILGRAGAASLNTCDYLSTRWKYRHLISGGRKWEKRLTRKPFPSLNELEEDKAELLKVINEATELARPCYSRGVNNFAWRVTSCIRSGVSLTTRADIPKGTSLWFRNILVANSVLDLASHDTDPEAVDFIWTTLNILRENPLLSEQSDMAEKVIQLLVSELAFSPFSKLHWAIGPMVARIIQLSVTGTAPASNVFRYVEFLLDRRLNEYVMYLYRLTPKLFNLTTFISTSTDPDESRLWEVPLLNIFASYGEKFADLLEGPRGLSSLVIAYMKIPGSAKGNTMGRRGYCLRYIKVCWYKFKDIEVDIPRFVQCLVESTQKKDRSSDAEFDYSLQILYHLRSNPIAKKHVLDAGIVPKLNDIIKKHRAGHGWENSKERRRNAIEEANLLLKEWSS